MSINYIWVCDALKQYIDPYPLDAPHVYVWSCHEWYGQTIRLINDCGDQEEYYLRKSKTELDANAWGGTLANTYRNVTQDALRKAGDYYPERWWLRP